MDAPVSEPRDPRTTIGGRYAIDLESPLGAGGMCLVYRGQDLRTRQEIAVKTLRLEYRRNPEIRARFRREARLIAFLAHPNVIRVIDFVDDRDTSWVVLEHVPGRSVQELIRDEGHLSLEAVAQILDQTAAALSHLHARGLVHLDVKPQNLLLTAAGDVKLIDFGLAQPAGGPQASINGRTFGTIGYLAPEQLRGDPVDASADVYALGGVVYEMLTGIPPYPPPASGEVTNSFIRARLNHMPVPPSLANPAVSVPSWVDDVVLWALAHDPGARYGSAVAFARIFRTGVDGEPLLDDALLDGQPPVEVAGGPNGGRVNASPLSVRIANGGGARRRATLSRRLWWAVAALVIVNLILALLLLATQGRVPGLYEPGQLAMVMLVLPRP